MTYALGYFGPGSDARRRGPSPWLVAGAIVALAGFCFYRLGTPPIEGTREDARRAAARMDVGSYSVAVDAFARDAGRYPTTAEGLAALVSKPGGLAGWNGPYVDRLMNDPWGYPFVYLPGGPKGGAGYRVLSVGRDGKAGTRDDIASGSDAAAPIQSAAPAVPAPSTQPW
jgi:general secretion pathway protein G